MFVFTCNSEHVVTAAHLVSLFFVFYCFVVVSAVSLCCGQKAHPIATFHSLLCRAQTFKPTTKKARKPAKNGGIVE